MSLKWNHFKSIFALEICITVMKVLLFVYLIGRIADVGKGTFIAFLGLTLFSYSFVFLFKSKVRFLVFYFLMLFNTFIILANLWNFRYFGEPLSIYSILQTANLSGLGPSIGQQIKLIDILFFVDFVLPFYFLQYRKSTQRDYVSFSLCLFVSLALIGLKLTNNIVVDKIPVNRLFYIYDRNDSAFLWSPGGYMFIDTVNYFRSGKHHELNVSEIQAINEWVASSKDTIYTKVAGENQALYGFGKQKNVLLIQVESLESYVIGAAIENQEITPNINKMLEHSYYFPSIYAQTNGGRSSDAELMVHTSIYPVKDGSTFFRFPKNVYPNSLPNRLKEVGYSTVLLHGDEASFWNRNQAYPGIGIDRYYDIKYFPSVDKIGMGISDKSFFKQSIEILKKEKQPIYGQLITLSSHTPFEIPKNLHELSISSTVDKTLANYLQSIHYTDAAIGLFMDGLEESGLMENSVVVIYGDHEALSEEVKQEIKSRTGFSWINSENNIPFIIYNPQLPKRVDTKIGGEIDINPTLFYLLGLEASSVMGKNLFSAGPGYAVMKDGSFKSKEPLSLEIQQREKKAYEIADLIIRSNYFGSFKGR